MINVCLKKQQQSQTNNFIPQKTGKRKTKPKVSRRKEITKIRVEINGIQTKKTIERSIKLRARSWFFEKINKIGQPSTRLTKKKERNQKIRSEIKKETSQLIQSMERDYYEQL